ncbi:MAG: cell division protein ZapE, partial [Rhodovibrionaceae bacterium]|nr:cell division protein ZapE [Rhodovibrionaceae bacterium]
VYRYPLGEKARADLERAFERLTEGAEAGPTSLSVKGRTIAVPLAARGVARFSFAELCEKPLGARDYLAIATHFHTVVLDGVPKLSTDKRNEARRFMTLVDALYEHRVKLIVAADAPPDQLYPKGDGAFEFQRTVSRLMEMQSKDYLNLEHLT